MEIRYLALEGPAKKSGRHAHQAARAPPLKIIYEISLASKEDFKRTTHCEINIKISY